MRKRTCLNKSGKCRGNSVQKKPETVSDEYEVEIDKGDENYSLFIIVKFRKYVILVNFI